MSETIEKSRRPLWLALLAVAVVAAIAYAAFGGAADTGCMRTQQALDTYGMPPDDIANSEKFKDEVARCSLELPEAGAQP